MGNLRKIFILLLGLWGCCAAMAQDSDLLRFEKRYTFYFRVNSDEVDKNYMTNSETLARMQYELGSLLERPEAIDSLVLYSTSSPEGRYERNQVLSKDRSKMAKNLVEELFPNIDRSRVKIGMFVDEDWDGLLELVEKDLELRGREQIIEIITTTSSSAERKEKLAKLENGAIAANLYKKHCDDLRYCVMIVKVITTIPNPIKVNEHANLVAPQAPAPKFELTVPPATPAPTFHKHITLKTNTLGWALTESNIAVEFDLAKHLSLSVPFYYSGGLDYFTETIKFRGIVLQPELRYFPKLAQDQTNGGFFVGAHFGLGWYNFAVNTDYRIQDHDGNRPAYGGGLGLGYTLKFKKNPRWGMEFELGAGVYDVLYDSFYNENNGPYNEKAVRDIWIGIDNAAVSFTYNFDLKKGGKK